MKNINVKNFVKVIGLVALMGLAGCRDERGDKFVAMCSSTGYSESVCDCAWDYLSANYSKATFERMEANPGYFPAGFQTNTVAFVKMCANE